MAFYGKVFVAEKEENFEAFFKGIGLPDEKAEKMSQFKPTQKLEKDGDNYTFTIGTMKGEKVMKFKSDVEFDDTFIDMNVKATFTINGNKFTQIIKFDNGNTLTINKEYIDNSFVEEVSHSKWDGIARRYYKAQ